MKKYFFLLPTLVLGLISLSALGQTKVAFKESQLMKSYSLGISYNKTICIIFPAGVYSVDLGNDAVLADKFTGVENVLRVKANYKSFPETNLSVITKDGKLYSFYVFYQEKPLSLSYKIEEDGINESPKESPKNLVQASNKGKAPGRDRNYYLVANLNQAPVTFENVRMHEADLKAYSQAIAKKPDNVALPGMNKNKISFDLDGIFIKDNVIFYSLEARNRSNINYDIDFIKFYIRDKKQAKRTAVQETEVQPVYVYPAQQTTIYGKNNLKRVYCLEKFTIPDKKILGIEMYEKNGGRVVSLSLKNRHIVNASLIKL